MSARERKRYVVCGVWCVGVTSRESDREVSKQRTIVHLEGKFIDSRRHRFQTLPRFGTYETHP